MAWMVSLNMLGKITLVPKPLETRLVKTPERLLS
jgi:hypothetical protein